MEPYRDGLSGLKQQVETKLAAVEAQERAVPEGHRALWPEAIRDRIAALRGEVVVIDDFERLSASDAALDRLLDLYDEARSKTPALLACEEVIPEPTPVHAPPWLIEEPWLVAFRDAIASHVAATYGAELERRDDLVYAARLRHRSTPLLFVAEHALEDVSKGVTPVCRCLLRTTIPATFPDLGVRPEAMRHAVGRALGLAREHELGDPTFDRAFWITGDPRAICVLTRPVRRALEALLDDHPVLEARDGVVTLRWWIWWRENGRAALPSAAVDALAGVRGAFA